MSLFTMLKLLTRVDELLASRVVDHLRQHCADHLTLKSLSDALSISESTTKRVIRQTWHCSFQSLREYFRVARMLNYLIEFPESKTHTLAIEGGWRSRTTLNAAVMRVTQTRLCDVRENLNTLSQCVKQIESHIQTATASVDARPVASDESQNAPSH